jgi:hypothetical protein
MKQKKNLAVGSRGGSASIVRELMPTSKVLTELTKQSPDAIRADLERIASERERLEREEAILRALLTLVPERPATPSAPKNARRGSTAKAAATNAGSARGKKPIVRDVALDLMRRQGYRPWSISELIEAVQEQKPEAKPPAIRVALRRLAEEDGLLIKDQHRNYRLNPEKHAGLQFALDAIGGDP